MQFRVTFHIMLVSAFIYGLKSTKFRTYAHISGLWFLAHNSDNPDTKFRRLLAVNRAPKILGLNMLLSDLV